MSLYGRILLPWLLDKGCAFGPITGLRGLLVPRARGRVLELGLGSGRNLAFYDPKKVRHVVGLDPLGPMRSRAEKAPRPAGLAVEVLPGLAEDLPFARASFDSVVCTFTLCSVDSTRRALAESRRVLKPGGRLYFCEHGLAPDEGVARWQRRVEPLWRRLAGNCHLTRPVSPSIRASGLLLRRRQGLYLPWAPRIGGWVEWGEAERP